MNTVYRALSDPTRRTIIQMLRQRDHTAGEIAARFDSANPTISRHLKVLREADLVQTRREGTTIIYTLNVSVLEEALCDLLDTFQIKPRRTTAAPTGRTPTAKRGANADDLARSLSTS